MDWFCGQCVRGGIMPLLAVMLSAATFAAAAQPAAQPPAAPAANTIENPMAVPGFWDPRRRPERPDLSRISIIRFLTETDYPPFDFAGPDGAPAGFNVDLARMICEEIKVACTVQMRRFDTLIASLNSNNGDAVIASIAETPETRKQRRFQRSLLPHAGALRVAPRLSTMTTCGRRRWKARKSRWSPAPRTRPI